MTAFVIGLILLAALAPPLFWAARYCRKEKLETPSDADFFGGAAVAATLGGGLVALLGALMTVLSCVNVVDANTVGIPTSFGSIGSPLDAGIHFNAPWTEIHQFSTRIQELSMLAATDEGDKAKDDSIEVRGSDGYKMNVDVTVRYFIDPAAASKLFKLVGSEDGVRQRLVRPDVRDRVRVAFADFTSEEGYTSARDAIAAVLTADLAPRLASKGLRLESVQIRNVKPDPVLGQAISDRAAAREKALQASIDQERQRTEAETRLEVAQKDAETKVAAAQGEANANQILSDSLSDKLLLLKQIEALTKANVVYVPENGNLIFGAKAT